MTLITLRNVKPVLAGESWWDELTKEQKAKYIEEHPNSKYARKHNRFRRAGGDRGARAMKRLMKEKPKTFRRVLKRAMLSHSFASNKDWNARKQKDFEDATGHSATRKIVEGLSGAFEGAGMSILTHAVLGGTHSGVFGAVLGAAIGAAPHLLAAALLVGSALSAKAAGFGKDVVKQARHRPVAESSSAPDLGLFAQMKPDALLSVLKAKAENLTEGEVFAIKQLYRANGLI